MSELEAVGNIGTCYLCPFCLAEHLTHEPDCLILQARVALGEDKT